MSKREALPQFADQPILDTLAAVSESYAVCEPAPKHTHVLFDIARSTQRQVGEYTYDSHHKAIFAAEPVIESLNSAMRSDGLLDRPIEMSGPNIIHPHAETDTMTRTTTIGPTSAPEGDDVEHQFYNGQVSGVFAGVGYDVRRVSASMEGQLQDHAEQDDRYKVDFYYQVEVGGVRQLLGAHALYAASLVTETTLEYYDDMQLRRVREALESLLTVESPEAAALIDELNRTLSMPRLKASAIRRIGTLVKDIYATGALRPTDTGALLDLITAYIDPQGLYDITVPHALCYDVTDDGRTVEVLAPDTDQAPRYDQQASEIILCEGYDCAPPKDPAQEYPDVTFSPSGVLEPFFVFEAEDPDDKLIIHVPLRHIAKYREILE